MGTNNGLEKNGRLLRETQQGKKSVLTTYREDRGEITTGQSNKQKGLKKLKTPPKKLNKWKKTAALNNRFGWRKRKKREYFYTCRKKGYGGGCQGNVASTDEGNEKGS